MAYTIACLGVTENDWETLGKQALETLDLEVARKAYTRLKDLRHLELITDLEQRKNRDEDQVLVADIAAFQVHNLLIIIRAVVRFLTWVGLIDIDCLFLFLFSFL